MPSKTKKSNPNKSLSTPVVNKDGPQTIDGFLHFSERDLLRYELSQHKVVNAIQGIGLKKRELDQYKLDVDQRLKVYQVEIADLMAHARTEENKLLVLQEELQKSYGLDFTQVTYDDVTGRITVLGEPVTKGDGV